jgi:predicted AlkP superfamily pyrophosphatase or phosphodiesterase
MKRFILFSCLFFVFVFQSSQVISKERATETPVILISLDGFARDYLEQYPTKNLHKLMLQGLSAEALLPVFPSKTFPNHLSLITGVYPINHGIIHNYFYHRKLKGNYYKGAAKDEAKWLTAKPLWTHAEQHKIKSAVYFWPESEAKVQGILPSYYKAYNKNTANLTRINQIIDWLKLPKKERPQFIVSYFSLVDHAGHHFGRNSKELALSVKKADDFIGVLFKRLTTEFASNATKPAFDLIIVSDHGMTQLKPEAIIDWQNPLVKASNVKVVNGQTQLLIYSSDQLALQNIEKHFKAQLQNQKPNTPAKYELYNKRNFPQYWHWNTFNAAIPDLILDANPPFTFKYKMGNTDHATHGFDINKTDDLQAIFIAYGKNFKANKTIKPFEVIDVAPLVLRLLKINDVNDLDGSAIKFTPFLQ